MKPEQLVDPQYRQVLRGFSQEHRTGVLTLLFTDMVGSTKLKQEKGDAAGVALIKKQQAVVRQVLSRFPDAQEISTAGDSFFITFLRPSDAVRFSLLLHAQLRSQASAFQYEIKVRIGIHMGEVFIEKQEDRERTHDLYGIQVDTTARIMSLAGGGQTLMTLTVFDNARGVLRGEEMGTLAELVWLDHGPYKVKGVEDPVRVCEVGEQGRAPLAPPADTDKAFRYISADQEPVLGWRPALDHPIPGTHWVLEEKLGEGGFGEVWRARHSKLKEQRVFKFCFRADRVRSLQREATLFKILKENVGEHPNIVRLYDVFFDEPPYYLAMEYVAGKNLVEWARQPPGLSGTPLENRLQVVCQVADALQAAHDAGIIHRDIKPSNIIIADRSPGPTGILVKLTDFGIGQVLSKAAVAGITASGITEMMADTRTSSHSGTQLYMAPEVVAGRRASIRSDIYSLGIVLYQLVLGDFSTPVTTDWRERVTDPLLREDLERCFAGEPALRYDSAGQLAANLRAMPRRRSDRERQERLQRAARLRKRLGVVLASAALAVTVIATLLGFGFRREKAQRRIAEQESYFATISLAERYIHELRYGKARALLAACKPAYRNWEWGYLEAQCHQDIMTLRPHLQELTAVAYSPDGKLLATAGDDSLIILSEAGSGRRLKSLKDTGPVTVVAFFPDRERLATGNADGQVKKWDLSGGQAGLTINEESDIVSLDISPAGSLIATSSWGFHAKVWDSQTGRERLTTPAHNQPVTSVKFSPDGKHLATASLDGTVKIWEVTSGRLQLTIKTGSELETVDFSPDGRYLATGGKDGLVKVWHRRSGRLYQALAGHAGAVKKVLFSPDNQLLASVGQDRTARLWDPSAGRAIGVLAGHADQLTTAAFKPDGRLLATVSFDGTVKIWPVTASLRSRALTGHTGTVTALAFGIGAGRLLSISSDNSAKLWDTRTGQEIRTFREELKYLRSAAFSPNGRFVATGASDKMVRVWEAEKGAAFLSLPVQNSSPVVTFSAGSRLVAAAAGEDSIGVWELVTGNRLYTLTGHTRPLRRLCFTADDQYLVSTDAGLNIKVWQVKNGQEYASFTAPAGDPKTTSLCSQRMVVGLQDYRTLRFYHLLTGQEVASLAETADITSFCFTPDRIFVGFKDHSIKVYDFTSGRELVSLKGHASSINALAYSQESPLLASGGADQTIILWETYPWQAGALPGTDQLSLPERLELYKRQSWKQRLSQGL